MFNLAGRCKGAKEELLRESTGFIEVEDSVDECNLIFEPEARHQISEPGRAGVGNESYGSAAELTTVHTLVGDALKAIASNPVAAGQRYWFASSAWAASVHSVRTRTGSLRRPKRYGKRNSALRRELAHRRCADHKSSRPAEDRGGGAR
jgi:hypothetical protein